MSLAQWTIYLNKKVLKCSIVLQIFIRYKYKSNENVWHLYFEENSLLTNIWINNELLLYLYEFLLVAGTLSLYCSESLSDGSYYQVNLRLNGLCDVFPRGLHDDKPGQGCADNSDKLSTRTATSEWKIMKHHQSATERERKKSNLISRVNWDREQATR